MSAKVPDEVRRFVLAAIPSVPHLEALLLLRADPARAWAPAEVAGRLYVDAARGEALLAELADQGLVQAAAEDRSAYRYGPRDSGLRDAVERLAEAYAREVVAITELIHARTDRRAQQFADAFRIRREN